MLVLPVVLIASFLLTEAKPFHEGVDLNAMVKNFLLNVTRANDDLDAMCESDGCKDCRDDCKDEFEDTTSYARLSCDGLCVVNSGKCPSAAESNSKCKDYAKSAGDYISEDDAKKICDIVCPKASLWWVGLVVGLVVIIAVVVVVVIICYVKKLLCFKGSS